MSTISPAAWDLLGHGLRPMRAELWGSLSYSADSRRDDAATVDHTIEMVEPNEDGCPFGHATRREDGRWHCVEDAGAGYGRCPNYGWRCRTCGAVVAHVVDGECVDCAEA